MRLLYTTILFYTLHAFTAFSSQKIEKEPLQFLNNYCIDCHDNDVTKADINLDFDEIKLDTEKGVHFWENIHLMVDRKHMPPSKKKKQPSQKERDQFSHWLSQKLIKHSYSPPPAYRRLNHREFEKSIQNIFHLPQFKLPKSYPRDYNTTGFDTNTQKLIISAAHLESIREVAIHVADTLFPKKKEYKSLTHTTTINNMILDRGAAQIYGKELRLAVRGRRKGNLASVVASGTGTTKFTAPVTGDYEVKILISAKNNPIFKDHIPQFSINARYGSSYISKVGTYNYRNINKADALFKVTNDKPQWVKAKVRLEKGEDFTFLYENALVSGVHNHLNVKDVVTKLLTHKPDIARAYLEIKPNPTFHGWQKVKKALTKGYDDLSEYKPNQMKFKEAINQIVKTESDYSYNPSLTYYFFENGPYLSLHKAIITGPHKVYETKQDHQVANRSKQWAIEFEKDQSRKSIETHFKRVLFKVFRKPPSKKLITFYSDLFEKNIRSGKSIRASLHHSARTMIVSPDFLFGPLSQEQKSPYSKAERLSRFILSSATPLDVLHKIKNKNIKNTQEHMNKLAEDLLHRSKSSVIQDFTRQWLKLDHLDMIDIDPQLSKTITMDFKKLYCDEAKSLAMYIFQHNRSMKDFIATDYITSSQNVAQQLYDLNIKRNKQGLVQVNRFGPRGGMLTTGAVLTLNSNGFTTQPIKRGAWLMENFIGMKIPNPPKDVQPLPEPDHNSKKKLSKFDLIKQHLADPGCIRCHKEMDPLGMVFENYDPIGRPRKVYPGSLGANKDNINIKNRGLVKIKSSIKNTSAENIGVSGKIGRAIKLDGIDDHIQTHDLSLNYPTSISLWINPKTTSGDTRILSQLKGAPTQRGAIAILDHDIMLWAESGWVKLIDFSKSWAGTWNHLTIVFNEKKQAVVYWNGIKKKTLESPGLDFNNSGIGFGSKYLNQYGNTFHGLMDDIRIYKKALSHKEVKALYSMQKVKETGKLVHLELEEQLKYEQIVTNTILFDGHKVKDAGDLKRWMMGRADQVVHCISEKILSYAIGRELNLAEKERLSERLRKHETKGWPFRDVLLDLVTSDLFYL